MLYSVIICIAYIIGIIWGLYLDFYLSVVPFFLIICVSLITILVLNKTALKTKMIRNLSIIILVSFLLGFANISVKNERFTNKYNEGNLNFKGEIINLVEEGDYYNKYIFKNDIGDKFLLYINKEFEIEETAMIEFTGKLELPSKQRNRGGFDYSKYMYSQSLYGSIFVENYNNIEILEESKFNLITFIQNNIFEALGKLLPKEQLGILLGMIIGDTFYITEEIENAFKQSGITHLLAVSGSNVTYIVLATKFLFEKIVRQKFFKLYNNIYYRFVCLSVWCKPFGC